ncbi:MAG: hypothetical protein JWP52_1609, partial [Rhizobacter sp.]|nr:hypothetical protein [Rhizobacter sp.]
MSSHLVRGHCLHMAWALLALTALPAHAVPVPPTGTSVVLPGTSAASRPELEGTVIEDVTAAWVSAIDPMYGFPGAIGSLQSSVLRSTSTGTLDFYWRITVSQPSYPLYVPQQLTISG